MNDKHQPPPTETPKAPHTDDELPPPRIVHVKNGAEPEQAQLGIAIREATPADRPEIDTLIKEAILHGATPAQHQPDSTAVELVAEQRGTIVGYTALSRNGYSRWYSLGPVTVLPEKRCLGIGTQLVSHALAYLSRLGAAGCTASGDPHFFSPFGFITATPSIGTETSSAPQHVLLFTDSRSAPEIADLHTMQPPDELGV